MKILIAGLGGIGQRHARNLRALLGDTVELLAWRVRGLFRVVTPALGIDTSRDVEREYGIRSFGELHSALAEKPDMAFITNPSSLHVTTALACVRAGCDVFLEKPLADRLDSVEVLADEAEKLRRVAMVGFQLRFHPCFRLLQKVVTSGELGRILAVRATVGEYLPGWHTYEDYRESYAARSDLGGGVVLSQIHEFDYLYALFGPARTVYALGGHRSRLEVDVEDVASTLMEHRVDGRPVAVHLHQDYLQRPASRGCEVIGDHGKAVMDLRALTFTHYDADGRIAATQSFDGYDRNQLFLDEIGHFLSCVSTRSKPIVDLRDGIWSLRMALAAKQSMATRGVVEVTADEYATSRC